MIRLALRAIGCGIAAVCLVEGTFREISLGSGLHVDDSQRGRPVNMSVKYVDVHEVEVDDLIFGVKWRPVARIVFNKVRLRWTYYDGQGIIIQSAVIGSRIQIIKEN